MITSLELTNFRLLRQATVPLGPLTLLVGPNGSGKSTVLRALAALRQPSAYCGAAFRAVDADRSPEPIIRILARAKDPAWVMRCVDGERWGARGEAYPDPVAEAFCDRIEVYSLDARALAEPVELEPRPLLGADGSRLAAVLDHLRDSAPERFEALNAELALWLPEFDRVLFETPRAGHRALCLRTREGYTISATSLSDGTMVALALLTLVHLPTPPSLIGIEEPDRGLHPRLMRRVADALRRLADPAAYGDDREPCQVVATTHSPYFLDLFRDHPEQVVVAERTPDGASFVRLSDQPDIEDMLDGSSLGEAYYGGLIGGVPAGV